ncbi:MAG: TIGR02757 family protein [Sulfuricurvum sp.]|uniref:TIGR02757 family protein n=1 Tax=Sulfuricurvum sp. TaxID=2025608 RepID=UPI002601046B|nr:TIGR02757 family protein [Sulfuricurvum sp.]MCK9372536.1 TIGR02757 family protein [Sulfuricurvum sp.]
MREIQERLNAEAVARNCEDELSKGHPDPLMVARRYGDETVALACALFSYGSAVAIVKFLESLDFSLLEQGDSEILRGCQNRYYRFQNSEDCGQFLITLKRLRGVGGSGRIFETGYREGGIIGGLNLLIETLYSLNGYRSGGYTFLIGKKVEHLPKASAMKRWMMYLRWMVRKDRLDMGLWKGIRNSDLIMPMDTHTFNVSRRLGLLKRSQCDLKAAMELTEMLKTFDPQDPVKYDFALYRLGQEKKG